jgi:hypothetical protein
MLVHEFQFPYGDYGSLVHDEFGCAVAVWGEGTGW